MEYYLKRFPNPGVASSILAGGTNGIRIHRWSHFSRRLFNFVPPRRTSRTDMGIFYTHTRPHMATRIFPSNKINPPSN
jgi:hypothetical protein